MLTETGTGTPATYVEGYTGSFKGSNASTWLKNFKGLNPSTGYTLTIIGSYDNLDGQKNRNWSRQVVFTTSDEYVTSNPLIYILNGSSLTLKVANLNNGSATITGSRLALYQYNAQTNTIGAQVAEKTIPVATSYPIDVSEQFDISSLMSGNEYLMARLEVTYDTDLGERDQMYTIQNIVYIGATRSLAQPLKVNAVAQGLTVQTDKLPTDVPNYTVIVANERGQTVAKTTATPAQLAKTLTIPTDHQAVSRVTVLNEESLAASYQTNQFDQTATAYYTKQQTILKKADALANQQYEVIVQKAEKSLANQLLKAVKTGLVFKTTTFDHEQLVRTEKNTAKVYNVTGAELQEGYTLPCSINQNELTIKEVQTGTELIIQKLEVVQ